MQVRPPARRRAARTASPSINDRLAPDRRLELSTAARQAPRVRAARRLARARVLDQAETGQTREQLGHLALVCDPRVGANREVVVPGAAAMASSTRAVR
jgi:hypothetical protein